jgi:hypothetical protein
VRWLIRRDTRAARWLVLKLRFRVSRFGDDYAETMTAALATVYGVVLLLPGDTTGHADAWRVLAGHLRGDVGIGLIFAALAGPLWLSAMRLIHGRLRTGVLLTALAVWVGMAVGFFLGYPNSLGPWVCALYAATAWMAYLRTTP